MVKLEEHIQCFIFKFKLILLWQLQSAASLSIQNLLYIGIRLPWIECLPDVEDKLPIVLLRLSGWQPLLLHIFGKKSVIHQ